MIIPLEQFARGRMVLEPVPDLPHVQLYRPRPDAGLGRFLADTGAPATPYWAWPWGGGLALARWLADEPHRVAGRRVLDLGCGGGLVAVAAMKAGAASALAVDIDPLALEMTRLNAEANAVAVETALWDGMVADADTILAGDVFYSPEAAQVMEPLLRELAEAGREIWIGDPGRRDLPRDWLRRVAEYQVTDFGGMKTTAAIYSLPPSPRRMPGSRS